MNKFFQIFTLASAFFLSEGSNCQASPSSWLGNFKGQLVETKKRTLDITLSSQSAKNSEMNWQLSSEAPNPPYLESIQFYFLEDNSIHLSSSLNKLDNLDLTEEEDGTCFSNIDLRICSNGDSIQLQQKDSAGSLIFSLNLKRIEVIKTAPNASVDFKANLTLAEALDLSKKRGFSLRIQYEALLQAKDRAKQAHLDLLPHLTLNSIVAVATSFNIISLVTGLTDLVPFLFPDRWAKAKAASALARAEACTQTLMQIETSSQIEETAILNWQEAQSIQFGLSISDKMEKLLSSVGEMESIGAYPNGTFDGLKVSAISLKEDILTFREMKVASLRSLATILAYPNLDDLKDVNVDAIKLKFDALPSYDRAETEALALQKSVAIQQLDALIEAAQAEKVAANFSWLDVSIGISAGHWSSVAVSREKIAELQARKEQLTSQTKRQVADTLGAFELAKESYRLANDKLMFQKSRLEKVLFQYQFGKNTGALELLNAIQEENRSELNILNAGATLMVIDSRIRKLILPY